MEEKQTKDRKIRVEFELDPEDVKLLLAAGEKGKLISTEELKRLSREGAIKASDYLDPQQIEDIALALPAYVSKVGQKVKKAISNPTVQAVVAKAVVQKISVQELGKERPMEEERPKE